jgi:hypothetical protein
MIRLDIKKEPYWLELAAEVRLKVKPLTSAIMHMAQAEAVRTLLAMQKERKTLLESGSDASHLPDLENELVRHSVSDVVLNTALAKHAILAWENVLVPETETPATLTPEHVGELMEIWFINQEFGKKYMRQLELLEAEGNVSRPAVNGTSAAGRATARTARKKNSPAAEESQAP